MLEVICNRETDGAIVEMFRIDRVMKKLARKIQCFKKIG